MKESFVVALVLVFSFVFVGAGSCDDGQTIMRLGGDENVHVSFWNESIDNYTNEVCYDEIFGSEYNGDNPHECSGSNRILSLYDMGNSHASETTDEDYSYEVCFGDLVCEYDNSAGGECANGGEVVVRMYSEYNSHVSDASDTNYEVKVCCGREIADVPDVPDVVPDVPDVSNVYWADMNGDIITEADFGDSVQMIAEGVTSGTFEILEEDIIYDDEIASVVGVPHEGNLVGVWTIGSDDLDKTSDYDKFYFKVRGEESGFLNVSLKGNNAPVNVTISSPSCGLHFDKGTTVKINVSAFDEDDIISGSVSVDGEVIENFGNGGVVASKTFDSFGNFQVVVETADGRSKRTRIISNIMILDKDASGNYVDGEYVAACISEPKDFSSIEGSVVNFDASDTRAVRIIDGVFDLLVPDEGDVFSWYWEFISPEGNIGETSKIREFIDSVDPMAYRFTAEFPIAGDNSAILKVELD